MKIFLSILLFAISINSLYSIDSFTHYNFSSEVNVGKSPSKVFTLDDNGFFVVCGGYDADFDANLDDGDEYPSVWQVTKNSEGKYISELKFTFDDFTNFPFFSLRCGLDSKGKVLFVPLKHKIVSLSLEDFSLIDDDISSISANAVEYVAGHLLVSYNDANSNGKLTVVNLSNNQELQTINIGINLQETIYYPGASGISIAALCVGAFGSDNSTVYYGAIDHKFDFSLSDSVVIGNTGNHLQYSDGKLYATTNMSHYVKQIDPATHEVKTLYTGTSAYNGPRESTVINGKLFVTTYSEDFRIYDLATNALVSIINSKNNLDLEGLTKIDDNTVAVAGIYNNDYSAANKVEIYSVGTLESPFYTYKVGMVPVWTANLDGVVHVICEGVDLNNNGQLDEGDENSSWWVIKNGTPTKMLEFAFATHKSFLIPAIDTVNKVLMVNINNSIQSFSYESFSHVAEIYSGINSKFIDYAGNYIVAAVNNENAPDSIYVINALNGTVLQKVYGNDDILHLKLYTSNVGLSLAYTAYNAATNEYTLNYGELKQQDGAKLENQIVIDSPTNMTINEGKITTASYTTGMVTMVDFNTKEVKYYNYATNNPQLGPTCAYNDGDYLYATSLNSDIRTYNTKTNELETILPLNADGWFVYNIGNTELNLAICSPLKDGATIPNNELFTYKQILVGVEENQAVSYDKLNIYPNPSTNYIRIETKENSLNTLMNIQIIDNSGKLVKTLNINSNEMIDVSNLGTGAYMLIANLNNNYYNFPLRIVR
ncbi:MAG TPA: T9SS type A sorting domain-containing protein [Candidatus Kapabacteria bacterium]|nr:T9SS type A sorting domain-containing protein [Candidatus Kapabacteria bacterium]